MSEPVAEPARVEISKRLVLINSAGSLLALGLNLTVLVWMQQYLLKRIGPEEYSLLPVLYSIMIFTPLLTTILTSPILRFVTEAYAAGDSARVTQIASTMFSILWTAGCLVVILGGVLTHHISALLAIAPEYLRDAKIMLMLLMLSLALRLAMSPFLVGLAVRQKFALVNLISTGGQLLRMGVLFILLTLVSPRVLWVIVATVSAGAIADIVTLALSLRALPCLRFRRGVASWPVARQLLSFGGWSTISAIALSITSSADAIILNRLGTALDVTCFYLGSLPLRFITMAGSVALAPLNPVLIAMHTQGQTQRLRGVFLKGGRWSLWSTLLVCVPLMTYGREIMSLYVGNEYRLAGIVMPLLLLAFPIGQGVRMMFPLAEATAKIRILSLCLLGMSVFNLGLTLYLVGILKMGALGSALGTGVSTALFFPIFIWPLGLKIAQVDFVSCLKSSMLPGLLPATANLAALLALKASVPLDSWSNIIFCVSLGSVVYLCAICYGGLQPDDKNDLIRLKRALSSWPPTAALMRCFKEAQRVEK